MKKLNRKQFRSILIKELNQKINEREEINKKYSEFSSFVLKKNKPLLESKRYLTQQELNEGILDTIMSYGGKALSNLFPGFINDLKLKIASDLISNLNLNPNAGFGRFLTQFFKNIEYSKFTEYISDWKTGCPKFVDLILRAAIDSFEMFIMTDFFGARNPNEVEGLIGTAREAIQKTLADSIIPVIAPKISEFICNVDISGMLDKIKSGVFGADSSKNKKSESDKNVDKIESNKTDAIKDELSKQIGLT